MPRSALIEFRRDISANWTSVNPTLASGEPGFETDTGKLKIGDGSTSWSSLPYVAITEDDIALSDVTTNNVTSSAHGFAPKSPADATKFLNGAATPAYAQPKDSDLSTSDVTTNNVSSSKHGFAPKSPADATQFLSGATSPGYAQVKDSDLSTTDITTNNVSITKHGFAPKAPNDATKYLDGTGAYTVPSGSGGGVTDVDGITGSVTLVAGSNITITDNSPSAGDITIASTASGASALASDKKTLTSGDITGWTTTTFTEISSSLRITITTGARRCLCTWSLMATNNSNSQQQVDVDVDGTRLGQTFGLVFAGGLPSGANANLAGSVVTSALSAASHTFKLMFRVDGNTSTIYASTSIAPIIFSVVELYA